MISFQRYILPLELESAHDLGDAVLFSLLVSFREYPCLLDISGELLSA